VNEGKCNGQANWAQFSVKGYTKATVSLQCGTLPTQLKRGLDYNDFGDSEEQVLLRKEVVLVINEMIRIGTEVTRRAQQAISLFIAKVTTQFPSLDE